MPFCINVLVVSKYAEEGGARSTTFLYFMRGKTGVITTILPGAHCQDHDFKRNMILKKLRSYLK